MQKTLLDDDFSPAYLGIVRWSLLCSWRRMKLWGGVAGICWRLLVPVAAETPEHYPRAACTAAELANLRRAWATGTGMFFEVVAVHVRRADSALRAPLEFPPRGGRHNQWYQCDVCQTGLKCTTEGKHICPICGREYTGAPYDDVIFGQKHHANLNRLLDCAWAFAITEQQKYAAYAERILTGYAGRYLTYPRRGTARWNWPYNYITGGRLFDQTLTEACVFATQIAPACDLVWPALNDGVCREVREKLLLPMLENIAGSWWNGGRCNWQSWHNAAMFWGGVLLDDPAWIKKSLDDQRAGFFYQLRKAISTDGMWWEGSWGYHFYALMALVNHAEAARRYGLDLWREDRLAAMFKIPLYFRMPDGALPRFGDGAGTMLANHPALWESGFYNLARCQKLSAVEEAAFAALLPKKPILETVMYGRTNMASQEAEVRHGFSTPMPADYPLSQVFPEAGYAVLRRGGDAALTAAVIFGSYGGAHGHLDKLSFVFYGFGRELGVDSGSAASQAYRLPIHQRWYKATLAHNAVLMNGRSQRPVRGVFEQFCESPKCVALTLSAKPWLGVEHRRLILLQNELLLVADVLDSVYPARFDWLYHQRGTQIWCNVDTRAQPPTALEGAEYVRNYRAGLAERNASIVFEDGAVRTILVLAGGGSTKIGFGDGPGSSVNDRIPFCHVSRSGRRVWFVAVVKPQRISAKNAIAADFDIDMQPAGAGRWKVRIKTTPPDSLEAVFGPAYLQVF